MQRDLPRLVLTVGLLMMAAGFVLPFVVGEAIPPSVYNVLQIGGIGVTIVGAIWRSRSGSTG